MARKKVTERGRSPYREANRIESEEHPVDDEVERRLNHRRLQKRIIAAQVRMTRALGEDSHLYRRVEELIGERALEREEVMFNVGYELGLARGRTEKLGMTWVRTQRRGRELTDKLIRDTVLSRVESEEALAALLKVVWGLAVGALPQDMGAD